MNANDPAFPCDWKDFQPTTGEQVVREQSPGLTKRELFAMAAMQGICANPTACTGNDLRHTCQLVAKAAVISADALLYELARKEGK